MIEILQLMIKFAADNSEEYLQLISENCFNLSEFSEFKEKMSMENTQLY